LALAALTTDTYSILSKALVLHLFMPILSPIRHNSSTTI
jgi:hypothetical protein